MKKLLPNATNDTKGESEIIQQKIPRIGRPTHNIILKVFLAKINKEIERNFENNIEDNQKEDININLNESQMIMKNLDT